MTAIPHIAYAVDNAVAIIGEEQRPVLRDGVADEPSIFPLGRVTKPVTKGSIETGCPSLKWIRTTSYPDGGLRFQDPRMDTKASPWHLGSCEAL